jgi:hypothetical protein
VIARKRAAVSTPRFRTSATDPSTVASVCRSRRREWGAGAFGRRCWPLRDRNCRRWRNRCRLRRNPHDGHSSEDWAKSQPVTEDLINRPAPVFGRGAFVTLHPGGQFVARSSETGAHNRGLVLTERPAALAQAAQLPCRRLPADAGPPSMLREGQGWVATLCSSRASAALKAGRDVQYGHKLNLTTGRNSSKIHWQRSTIRQRTTP